MSTWNTGPNLGSVTQGQPVGITLSASPSQGGSIQYRLQTNSQLPPGLSLNAYTGAITGTTQFVNDATTYTFTVSATEITVNGVVPNPQAFSLTVNNIVWVTDADLGLYVEDTAIDITLAATPSNPANRLSYTLLNGSLPAGTLTLQTEQNFVGDWIGKIRGVPSQVNQNTESTFTVRAIEYNTLNQPVAFRDRTFLIKISGETVPRFITLPGVIFTVDDSTWFPYQIEYSNPDPNTTATIRVVVGNFAAWIRNKHYWLDTGLCTTASDSTTDLHIYPRSCQ